jgi:probable F420-dependent oxidoreductase
MPPIRVSAVRLAFSPTTVGVSAGDLVSLCVEAERLGYDSAWVAEVAGPEAFSLAGAIAAVTERIDVGVAVVAAATRSPALLAMAASTASSILAGRSFHLGIGSSSEVIVRDWHGAEFDPPLVRVGEAVEATRALLSGERGYSGTTVQVDRFRLAGGGDGPIGIYIGALGPQMLRLAGAVADGVCLNLGTAEGTGRQIEEVRAGASRAGRDLPESFDVMARFHVVMTEDPGQGRDLIRAGFGPYFAQPVYNRFLAWMGYPQEAVAVAAAFASGDRAGVAAALHDEIIDSMTIVGPAPRIRDRLAEYEESGVDVAALSFLGVDSAGVAAALQALAP